MSCIYTYNSKQYTKEELINSIYKGEIDVSNVISLPEFSKVVDENGEPLVVYHSTNRNVFTEFKLGNGGIFFTPSKKDSINFVKAVREEFPLSFTVEAFLNIRNPKNYQSFWYEYLEAVGYDREGRNRLRSYLTEGKFDGIFIEDPYWNDTADELASDSPQWIAFKPNQAKLADGTNTTFNSESNDIRYSIGQEVPQNTITEKQLTKLLNTIKKAFPKLVIFTDKEIFDKKMESLGMPKYMMEAWHVSDFLFDKFNKNFIGSNFGTLFGHGFYFTSENDVASYFSKRPVVSINNTAINDMAAIYYTSNKLDRNLTDEQFLDALNKSIEKDAELLSSFAFGESIIEGLKSLRNAVETKTPIEVDGRYKYKVTINDNFLEWDAPVPKNILNRIKKGISDSKIEKAAKMSMHLKTLNTDELFEDANGEQLYRGLTSILGNEQAASQYLLSLGINGMRYPMAKEPSVVTNKKGYGYVVYSSDAIKIDEVVKFLKTSDGEILGATFPDGSIYIDNTVLSANTPIHEAGHLFKTLVQKSNPTLWNKIKKAVEDTKYIKEIQDDPDYSNLKTPDDIADEAFSRLLGDYGEGKWLDILDKVENKTTFDKIIDYLKDFINTVKEFFGADLYKDMTAEDFAEMTLGELLGGKAIENRIAALPTTMQQSLQKIKDTFKSLMPKITKIAQSKFTRTKNAETLAEMAQIINGAKLNKEFMLAPNGKPTKLSENDWAYVRTEEFLGTHGEWQGIAVANRGTHYIYKLDSNGEPILDQPQPTQEAPRFTKLKNEKLYKYIRENISVPGKTIEEIHKALMQAGFNSWEFEQNQVPFIKTLVQEIFGEVEIKESTAEFKLEDFERQAGGKLIRVETKEQYVKYTKYYRPEDSLCSFTGQRLIERFKNYNCWIFVKDGADKITPKEGYLPNDEYSTSVMVFFVAKPDYAGEDSIISRYNHSVRGNQPNLLFNAIADNFYDGMSAYIGQDLFKNKHGKLGVDYKILNKKIYKYETEIGGTTIYSSKSGIIINGVLTELNNFTQVNLGNGLYSDSQAKNIINAETGEKIFTDNNSKFKVENGVIEGDNGQYYSKEKLISNREEIKDFPIKIPKDTTYAKLRKVLPIHDIPLFHILNLPEAIGIASDIKTAPDSILTIPKVIKIIGDVDIYIDAFISADKLGTIEGELTTHTNISLDNLKYITGSVHVTDKSNLHLENIEVIEGSVTVGTFSSFIAPNLSKINQGLEIFSEGKFKGDNLIKVQGELTVRERGSFEAINIKDVFESVLLKQGSTFIADNLTVIGGTLFIEKGTNISIPNLEIIMGSLDLSIGVDFRGDKLVLINRELLLHGNNKFIAENIERIRSIDAGKNTVIDAPNLSKSVNDNIELSLSDETEVLNRKAIDFLRSKEIAKLARTEINAAKDRTKGAQAIADKLNSKKGTTLTADQVLAAVGLKEASYGVERIVGAETWEDVFNLIPEEIREIAGIELSDEKKIPARTLKIFISQKIPMGVKKALAGDLSSLVKKGWNSEDFEAAVDEMIEDHVADGTEEQWIAYANEVIKDINTNELSTQTLLDIALMTRFSDYFLKKRSNKGDAILVDIAKKLTLASSLAGTVLGGFSRHFGFKTQMGIMDIEYFEKNRAELAKPDTEHDPSGKTTRRQTVEGVQRTVKRELGMSYSNKDEEGKTPTEVSKMKAKFKDAYEKLRAKVKEAVAKASAAEREKKKLETKVKNLEDAGVATSPSSKMSLGRRRKVDKSMVAAKEKIAKKLEGLRFASVGGVGLDDVIVEALSDVLFTAYTTFNQDLLQAKIILNETMAKPENDALMTYIKNNTTADFDLYEELVKSTYFNKLRSEYRTNTALNKLTNILERLGTTNTVSPLTIFAESLLHKIKPRVALALDTPVTTAYADTPIAKRIIDKYYKLANEEVAKYGTNEITLNDLKSKIVGFNKAMQAELRSDKVPDLIVDHIPQMTINYGNKPTQDSTMPYLGKKYIYDKTRGGWIRERDMRTLPVDMQTKLNEHFVGRFAAQPYLIEAIQELTALTSDPSKVAELTAALRGAYNDFLSLKPSIASRKAVEDIIYDAYGIDLTGNVELRRNIQDALVSTDEVLEEIIANVYSSEQQANLITQLTDKLNLTEEEAEKVEATMKDFIEQRVKETNLDDYLRKWKFGTHLFKESLKLIRENLLGVEDLQLLFQEKFKLDKDLDSAQQKELRGLIEDYRAAKMVVDRQKVATKLVNFLAEHKKVSRVRKIADTFNKALYASYLNGLTPFWSAFIPGMVANLANITRDTILLFVQGQFKVMGVAITRSWSDAWNKGVMESVSMLINMESSGTFLNVDKRAKIVTYLDKGIKKNNALIEDFFTGKRWLKDRGGALPLAGIAGHAGAMVIAGAASALYRAAILVVMADALIRGYRTTHNMVMASYFKARGLGETDKDILDNATDDPTEITLRIDEALGRVAEVELIIKSEAAAAKKSGNRFINKIKENERRQELRAQFRDAELYAEAELESMSVAFMGRGQGVLGLFGNTLIDAMHTDFNPNGKYKGGLGTTIDIAVGAGTILLNLTIPFVLTVGVWGANWYIKHMPIVPFIRYAITAAAGDRAKTNLLFKLINPNYKMVGSLAGHKYKRVIEEEYYATPYYQYQTLVTSMFTTSAFAALISSMFDFDCGDQQRLDIRCFKLKSDSRLLITGNGTGSTVRDQSILPGYKANSILWKDDQGNYRLIKEYTGIPMLAAFFSPIGYMSDLALFKEQDRGDQQLDATEHTSWLGAFASIAYNSTVAAISTYFSKDLVGAASVLVDWIKPNEGNTQVESNKQKSNTNRALAAPIRSLAGVGMGGSLTTKISNWMAPDNASPYKANNPLLQPIADRMYLNDKGLGVFGLEFPKPDLYYRNTNVMTAGGSTILIDKPQGELSYMFQEMAGAFDKSLKPKAIYTNLSNFDRFLGKYPHIQTTYYRPILYSPSEISMDAVVKTNAQDPVFDAAAKELYPILASGYFDANSDVVDTIESIWEDNKELLERDKIIELKKFVEKIESLAKENTKVISMEVSVNRKTAQIDIEDFKKSKSPVFELTVRGEKDPRKFTLSTSVSIPGALSSHVSSDEINYSYDKLADMFRRYDENDEKWGVRVDSEGVLIPNAPRRSFK